MTQPGLSDRAGSGPLPGFGADTVRLRGPATWELFEQLPDKRFQQLVDDDTGELTDVQRGARTALRAERSWMTVTADLRSGYPCVNLEFSAPALVHGHNGDPLPLSCLPETSRAAWAVAESELSGLPRFDDLHLTRLDLVRTISGVSDIPRTLWLLSHLRASRVRIDNLARGRSGDWQSLTRGNVGSWRAVGYGKAEEMRDRAFQAHDADVRALLRHAASEREDHLRWELQLRDLLREAKLTSHTSIDEKALRSLAQHHFHRTRFSEVIDGGPQRARALIAALPRTQQRGVLALLAAELLDLPVPMTHNPESTYKQVLRDLQVTGRDLLSDAGDPLRLDFETGTQVTDTAGATALAPPVSRP